MDTTQTNEIIKQLYAEKFTIWNVKDKQPILKYGISWAKCCYDDINIDFNKLEYGIRTGKQENGRYIIGLDFDTYKKEASEYIECKATKQLLSVFEDLNINNEGLFISSTENNRGCLVDATNCEELIKVIEMDGRAKIQKNGFCLEVLTGFNFVIPPTMTICKKRQKALTPRQFLNIDKPILDLKPDSDIYNFIFDYINSSLVKTKINKSGLRKTLNYDCIIEEINNEQPILKSTPTAYFNHIKQCLLILNPDRVNNYNSWFNISMSLKNCKLLNDTEKYELYKHFSNSGNYTTNEGELKKHWDKWDKYINTPNYEHYNTNYILRLCNYDNPDLFYKVNLTYKQDIKDEEYNNKIVSFNKEVIKILKPSIYLTYNDLNKKWIISTFEDIKHAYNETYGQEFLKQYYEDNNKLYYDYYDFIPMLDLIEYKKVKKIKETINIYNDFSGYAITKYENPNITNCDSIINLIADLCNNNDKTIEFLTQWLAHLIFNTCNRCFKVPILKGSEGCGKGTINIIIKRIIGAQYCFMTSNASNDIFSRFNDILTNKIFININEAHNFANSDIEVFKSLIADERFNMEAKGQPKIELSNYMWFLITTNNDMLFNISNSNRRFYFIECSNKNANNKTYFNKIYDDIKDDNIIYSFYKYLQGQFNINFDFDKALNENTTEYHNALSTSSKVLFYIFLDELLNYDEYINDEYIFINPTEIFNKFKEYARAGGDCVNETGKTIKAKLLISKCVMYDRLQHDGKRQMTFRINRKDLLTYITNNKLI